MCHNFLIMNHLFDYHIRIITLHIQTQIVSNTNPHKLFFSKLFLYLSSVFLLQSSTSPFFFLFFSRNCNQSISYKEIHKCHAIVNPFSSKAIIIFISVNKKDKFLLVGFQIRNQLISCTIIIMLGSIEP
jgi:hypothetical protein